MTPEWWVARGPHGGFLAAVMLRAIAEKLADPTRQVRSFTTHFSAAPKEGDISILTRVERSGRSASFVAARAEQNGTPVALSLAAFSSAWPPKLEFQDAPLPQVPSPEKTKSLDDVLEHFPPFLRNFEIHPTTDTEFFSGAEKAEIDGWIRMRDPQVADSFVVACLMDAFAPVVFPKATEMFVAPTLDLTIHFRHELPLEGATPEDYYFGHFSSVAGHDGFFEEDGVLWSRDGKLIAQSRQLALMI